MTAATSIRLADYTPWAFELPAIALDVNIQSDHVVVSSRLSLKPRRSGEPLVLCGVDLAIESLAIDQTPLQPEDYSFTDGRLTIPNVPGQPFGLCVDAAQRCAPVSLPNSPRSRTPPQHLRETACRPLRCATSRRSAI